MMELLGQFTITYTLDRTYWDSNLDTPGEEHSDMFLELLHDRVNRDYPGRADVQFVYENEGSFYYEPTDEEHDAAANDDNINLEMEEAEKNLEWQLDTIYSEVLSDGWELPGATT